MSDYAVLIPVVSTEQGEALLMEVRSEYVRQPGEICFPGGRIEPGETASDTAVRETCEELGILPGSIKICGDPELEVMSDGRNVYSVRASLPVLRPDELKLARAEVADAFLLPVGWLRDNPSVFFDLGITPDEELPGELRKYLSHYSEYRRKGTTDYWEYDGHGIWGLTARIIKRFLEFSQITHDS